MGPKLMNCCKPEQVGTKEHGNMLKRIQILEGGRVPAKEGKIWKIEGQRRRIINKEYTRHFNELEMGGFTAQTGLWNLARDKMLQDRGALPKEEGDVIGEYKVMHEENYLSGWLREGGEGRLGNQRRGEHEEGKRRGEGRGPDGRC